MTLRNDLRICTRLMLANDQEFTAYQTYIHLSKYSRWRDDLGRRETWDETVDRYLAARRAGS